MKRAAMILALVFVMVITGSCGTVATTTTTPTTTAEKTPEDILGSDNEMYMAAVQGLENIDGFIARDKELRNKKLSLTDKQYTDLRWAFNNLADQYIEGFDIISDMAEQYQIVADGDEYVAAFTDVVKAYCDLFVNLCESEKINLELDMALDPDLRQYREEYADFLGKD